MRKVGGTAPQATRDLHLLLCHHLLTSRRAGHFLSLTLPPLKIPPRTHWQLHFCFSYLTATFHVYSSTMGTSKRAVPVITFQEHFVYRGSFVSAVASPGRLVISRWGAGLGRTESAMGQWNPDRDLTPFFRVSLNESPASSPN